MVRWSVVVLGILAVLPAWVAAEDERQTLTVTMRLAEAEWQVMRQHILPTFEILCRCEVHAIDVPPETLAQRLTAMNRADRMDIDLFAQDNMRLQELVDAGLVSPLTDQESRMSDSVYPALRAAGIIDGRRYFVPFRPNVQIAYYNADKFAEYGLQPPRTWPELLAVARAFAEHDGIGRVLFKGAGGAPTTTQLYEWIVAGGGDPFDFAHPGTVATFEFLASLRPYLSPESRRAKWDTTNDALAQDAAFLAQNWPFGVPLLVKDYGKTAIHTYSGWAGPERQAHVIGGDVLGIPVGARNRELALAMIQYLQSHMVQEALGERLGWPSLRSDVQTAGEEWMRPHADAVQEALSHGVFRANVGYWADYDRLANEAVQRVLWRGEDPREVLPPIAARLDALRKGE